LEKANNVEIYIFALLPKYYCSEQMEEKMARHEAEIHAYNNLSENINGRDLCVDGNKLLK
jgi:hypothetical protein